MTTRPPEKLDSKVRVEGRKGVQPLSGLGIIFWGRFSQGSAPTALRNPGLDSLTLSGPFQGAGGKRKTESGTTRYE
jgi:hypothetical protein